MIQFSGVIRAVSVQNQNSKGLHAVCFHRWLPTLTRACRIYPGYQEYVQSSFPLQKAVYVQVAQRPFVFNVREQLLVVILLAVIAVVLVPVPKPQELAPSCLL